MLPIFIANSFYIFALGLVIPSLPFMVLAREGDAAFASIIFSTFSAAAFLAQPIWGILADKYGAKQILIISAILTSFAYFGIFLSKTVQELFIARIFAGLAAGWLTASLAYMANISTKKNRTKAMGILGASFGIGFTLGPATSGIILQNYNYEFTSLISGVVSLMVGILSIFLLPKSRKNNKEIQQKENFIQRFLPNFKEVFVNSTLKLLFFCYFIVLLVFTALEGSFALWVKFILGKDAKFLSWILTASGIVSIIIQGGLLGKLNKIFSEKSLTLAGILFLICGFLLLPFSTNQIMAFLPVILVTTGLSLHNPCMQSLVSKNVAEEQHGITMGSLQSCSSLSRIFGPAIAGYLFVGLGAIYFYWLCATILLVIFIFILLRLINHQKNN